MFFTKESIFALQFLNKVIHLRGRVTTNFTSYTTFTILQVGTSKFVYSIIPQYFFLKQICNFYSSSVRTTRGPQETVTCKR